MPDNFYDVDSLVAGTLAADDSGREQDIWAEFDKQQNTAEVIPEAGITGWINKLPKNISAGLYRAALAGVDTAGDVAHAMAVGAQQEEARATAEKTGAPPPEFPKPSSLRDLAPEFYDNAHAFGDSLSEGNTMADDLTQGVAQFALPFAGWMKALGTLGMTGNVVRGLTAETIAASTAFEPHDGRLADLARLGRESEGKFGDVLRTIAPDGSLVNRYIDYMTNRGPTTHDGLPAVHNDDGSFSTEISITVTDPRLNDGKPTNIPSLWGRKVLSEDDAVKAAVASGNKYKSFDSIDSAVDAAVKRSERKGREAQFEGEWEGRWKNAVDNLAGTAIIAGLLKGAGTGFKIGKQALSDTPRVGRRGQEGMVAYHGAKANFDRFDSNAIGSGEGNQSFGHGLYFAENPDTAKYYQRTVGSNGLSQDQLDAYFTPGRKIAPYGTHNLTDEVLSYDNKTGRVIVKRDGKAVEYGDMGADKLKVEKVVGKNNGRFYTVDIPDDAPMLDWDQPLSSQPQHVQDAIKNAVNENKDLIEAYASYSRKTHSNRGFWSNEVLHGSSLDGETAYRALTEVLGSQEAATKALQKGGLKGIKYLDSGSRNAKDGSRNLVVFDDSIIKILKKE